ncbi:MAG: methyltransferase family protein [Acidimicrobiales bacterium]
MKRLENTIPPPVLWLVASILTFVVDRFDLDGSPLQSTIAEWGGVALAAVGVGIAMLGGRRFARAGTTFDPHTIDSASTLVTGGIYRVSRNPMYLGLVLLSIGWALRLGTAVGMIVGTGSLVIALTYLQIRPEERALRERFGDDYDRYRSTVRRWI